MQKSKWGDSIATAKKLPSGSFRVNLYIGKDTNGKRKYKSFTAPTKKEAEYLAAQYNQIHIDVNRSELLLSDAVERYIKSKENVLSPSTVRGYYAILRNYLPCLMQTRLKELNTEVIQEQFNVFAKDHSPKTCRNAYGLISSTLKINRPDLQLNITLPQKQKRNIYIPSEADILKISKLLDGSLMKTAFLLACQCGLRASEISALKKKFVYADHIEIKEARVVGVDGDVTKAPKSVSGYRNVPISKSFFDFLISSADEEGYICNMRAPAISNSWTSFRRKNGFDEDFNFHALRHYYASKCLLLGMPQKYIAELMGHSSLDMIEKVYQHTFPSAMEVYAEKIREQIHLLLTESL